MFFLRALWSLARYLNPATSAILGKEIASSRLRHASKCLHPTTNPWTQLTCSNELFDQWSPVPSANNPSARPISIATSTRSAGTTSMTRIMRRRQRGRRRIVEEAEVVVGRRRRRSLRLLGRGTEGWMGRPGMGAHSNQSHRHLPPRLRER